MGLRNERKAKWNLDLNATARYARRELRREPSNIMTKIYPLGETSGNHCDLDDGSDFSNHEHVDLDRIRRAVREILAAVGDDPDREGLRETPDRVARMYAEVFRGLREDPRVHLKKLFTQKYDEMVLIKDIRFESFCEHHLLPFTGVAHVAYLPNGKVIGLSKIPRVIDVLAKRPQMQERLTEEVADLLMKELNAKGVAVVVEASHSCMTVRGVHKTSSSFVTSAMRGAFKERLATRTEVMSLIFGGRARE
jgi:GTP cyclohydrolase I